MAYNRSSNPWQQTRQDTGWGLIYRLNLLMAKIEHDVESGNLESWNLHIDRIYANILFKNDYEIIKDSKGKVLDIKLNKEDIEIFSRFAERIEEIKNKVLNLNFYENDYEKHKEYHRLKKELYNLIFKKDIWIRKKMSQVKLYLKEVEHDPRKAIYGG